MLGARTGDQTARNRLRLHLSLELRSYCVYEPLILGRALGDVEGGLVDELREMHDLVRVRARLHHEVAPGARLVQADVLEILARRSLDDLLGTASHGVARAAREKNRIGV